MKTFLSVNRIRSGQSERKTRTNKELKYKGPVCCAQILIRRRIHFKFATSYFFVSTVLYYMLATI